MTGIQRYVMRPVAKDVIEFDGTFASALEIANWMRSSGGAGDGRYKLDAVSDPRGITGKPEEHLTLYKRAVDALGLEFYQPILSWGHIKGSFKSTPLTISTMEGNMAAYPGYFIVQGAIGEFHAVHPDAFHKTYRKQNVARAEES